MKAVKYWIGWFMCVVLVLFTMPLWVPVWIAVFLIDCWNEYMKEERK